MSEQVIDLVKAGDNLDTLIREENREKKKRENGANAPILASLDSANAVDDVVKGEQIK